MEIEHRPGCELLTVPVYGLCTCDFDERAARKEELAAWGQAVEKIEDEANCLIGAGDWRRNRCVMSKPDPGLILRVDSIELTGDFQRMSPTAKLPWSLHPTHPWEVVDADGNLIAKVFGPTHADSIRTAGMIITAANTCGGIRMTES